MSGENLTLAPVLTFPSHLLRPLWEPDSSVKPEGDPAGRLVGNAVEGTVAVSKGTEPHC